jgi:hypothetical protein
LLERRTLKFTVAFNKLHGVVLFPQIISSSSQVWLQLRDHVRVRLSNNFDIRQFPATSKTTTTKMTTIRDSPQSQGTLAQQAPISELLPLVSSSLSAVISLSATTAVVLFQLLRSIALGVLSPVYALLPISAYILAPAFVFVSLAVEILILWPYSLLLHILHVVYPVYVFCGVAFIVSVIVGYLGRALIASMKAILLESREAVTMDSPAISKRKPSQNRRKRVKIEE